MKRISKIGLAFLIFNFQFLITHAQISINETGTSPDASAMLEVSSTEKGILIPRMTTAERTAIEYPATGLMVYDNDENSFWYYNDSDWTAVGSSSAFTSENGITSSTNNDDDFVFGVDSINYGSGYEYKFFFDKSKAAFRAGEVGGTNWDEENIGYHSVAFGENNLVSGSYSFSTGEDNEVTESYAHAFGEDNIISDEFSTAFGEDNNISGYNSFVSGESLEISGDYSTAFGYSSEISSDYSVTFGYGNDISGDYSVAFGEDNDISEEYSFATGYNNTISGRYASTLGRNLTVPSYAEVAVGSFNTTYTPNATTSFNNSDRLFVIGNGRSVVNRSDAMIVYKNGNTAINGQLSVTDTVNLSSALMVNGKDIANAAFYSENGLTTSFNNSDDFLFGGDSLNYGGSGDEYKFFFDKSKGAFRAGMTDETDWDESNLGEYSTAFGENSIVSGEHGFAGGKEHTISGEFATAFGEDNEITDNYSFAAGLEHVIDDEYAAAFGYYNQLSGYASFAGGEYHDIDGDYSTAFGQDHVITGSNVFGAGDDNVISGNYAIALGRGLEVPSRSEIAIGAYNTTYTPTAATSFNDADRLFVIGNGGSIANRSDAMIVYKSGNTAINGQLTISDTVNVSSALIVNGKDLTNTAFTSENGFTHTINNDDDFVVGADSLNWNSGNEDKLIFHKSNGAFRVGRVQRDDWDEGNLGNYSFATGLGNEATGNGSFAAGGANESSHLYTVAMGSFNEASGLNSTAFGYSTIANNSYATTFGKGTTASGYSSTAFGEYTIAPSYVETVIGIYNTTYTPDQTSIFDNDDRLFVIGNGTGSNSRSDAMIVYKNGDTEINGGTHIADEKSGTDEYIMTIENTQNDNSSHNNGLLIKAGHDSYTSSNRSSLIRFNSPNGTNLGRIRQNGSSDISLVNSSDIRLKENIQPTQFGIEDILKIEVRDYNFKADTDKYTTTGFLAQQLHTIFPIAVTVGDDPKTNPWGVDYARLTPLLVKGIQDQQQIIKEQNDRIEELEIEVTKIQQLEHLSRDLVEQNAKMKAMLEQIQGQLLSGQLSAQPNNQ